MFEFENDETFVKPILKKKKNFLRNKICQNLKH